MKTLHPDVSQEEDSSERAVRVIEAYRYLMGGSSKRLSEEEEEEATGKPGDSFDFPDGPADQLFVDPFACLNVDPLMWRELQSVAE